MGAARSWDSQEGAAESPPAVLEDEPEEEVEPITNIDRETLSG